MNRDPERSVEQNNPEFKPCFYDLQAVGPGAKTVNVGFFSIICIMYSESIYCTVSVLICTLGELQTFISFNGFIVQGFTLEFLNVEMCLRNYTNKRRQRQN